MLHGASVKIQLPPNIVIIFIGIIRWPHLITRHKASTSTRWHFAFGAMLS